MNDEESSASSWERRSQFTMNITGCGSVRIFIYLFVLWQFCAIDKVAMINRKI
jgi:hypothetical protein